MSFKSNGNLEKLQKNMLELTSTNEVNLGALMQPEFISSCSRYASLEELIDASGFKVESKEGFEVIPDDEWEEFIQNNTSHESWGEMQKAAFIGFTKANLLKGLK